MSEWQPIETAPKDATNIMLWEMSFDQCVIGYGTKLSKHLTESSTDHVLRFCTHWMPLPAPPEDSTNKTNKEN